MNIDATLPGRAWRATANFRPILILVVAMFVFFTITQGAFATNQNLKNMLADSAILWVIAMGMTFVLLSGGFDLSVGATAALVGIFMVKVLALGIPGGVVLALMVLFGALVGALLNGIPIGRLNLSVFVVTLASMIALTGLVELWSGSESYYVTAPIAAMIGVDNVLGLPVPIWIMAAVFVAALYVQRFTFFGRDVYAIGGSPVAARLAGIRVPRTLMIVYGLMGACAALAGAIAVGRVGAATPTVDSTIALQAIAAVLLGGTALTGGSGGVGGTAVGVLFIAILQNGLSLAGVSSDWQNVVTGVILLLAVLSDRFNFSDLLRRSAEDEGEAGAGGPPAVAAEGQPRLNA
ncbi:MAG: ABC transporter permease [Actinobacteria bacterium]|nr:ABC transporter permease [Actinomycetota bacterium]